MKTFAFVLLGLVTTLLAKADFSASEKFVKTCPVSTHAVLSLNNVNGSVEIIAWDKNEILIEAEKRAPEPDDLANIVINVDATPDHVSIKTEYVKTGWFGNRTKGAVNYVVHVPVIIDLREIESVNSNITIHNVDGQVLAKTVNGNIRVSAITTSAELHTINGNIEAIVASNQMEREISAKTVNGSCKLTIPTNLSAKVEGSTVNGEVKSTLPLQDITSSRKKLEGHMGQGASAAIKAHTVNGNITFSAE